MWRWLSSADITIGSISKHDLRRFLRWAATHLGYASLAEIEVAPPIAELEPIQSNYSQLGEVDMGMTYEELSVYGRLRKIFHCGPVSVFQNLCYKWGAKRTPSEVADKVKHYDKISGRSRGFGFVKRRSKQSRATGRVYERRIATSDLVDGDSSQTQTRKGGGSHHVGHDKQGLMIGLQLLGCPWG